MSELSKEELTEVITQAVKAAQGTNESHSDDHEFVQHLKRKAERQEVRMEKFKQSAIGTIAVSCVGGLIWIGKLVVENLGHHQ